MVKQRLVYPASGALIAALLGAGVATQAQAQAAGPAANRPAAAPPAVEEVVVTAQRRSEAAVDVPISIAVFSQEQLARSSVTSSADLQKMTPGLRMDQTGVFAVPTIRGVGTPVTGSAASPTAIYIDGIYQPIPAANTFDLVSVDSVQVLKGPQGTLFGRNSEGGAILVTTLDPSSTPALRAQVEYGSYNERKASLYVSGPLTEGLSANLTLYGRHNDNYLKNYVTGSEKVAPINYFTASGKLKWEASEDLTFILKATHNDISDPSGHNYTAAVNPATGRQIARARGIAGANVGRPPFDIALDLDPRNRIIQNSASLKIQYDFDWATLTSYSSWIQERDREQVDQDASDQRISEFEFGTFETDWQQEINLAGQWGDKLDWVTGLYYAHADAKSPWFYAVTTAGRINTASTLSEGDAYAIYADGTYNFAPRWYLTLGARYSYEEKSAVITASQTSPQFVNVPLNATFDAITPRVVLRYEITPESNVYASYSQGQKSGIFNTSARLAVVDPESLTAYEIGYKAQSDRWRFSTALFHYDYEDIQFQNTVAGVGTITSNAGTAESYGGEAGLSADITSEFSVNLGVAYTHARYESFKGAVIAVPRADDLGNDIVTRDVSGKAMIRAPEWTASLGANWRREYDFGAIELSGNYYYSTRVFFQADENKIYSQPDYGLLDLRASWSAPSDRYQVALWGRNVLDEHYMNQASPDAAAGRVRYGAPATFGVMLGLKY